MHLTTLVRRFTILVKRTATPARGSRVATARFSGHHTASNDAHRTRRNSLRSFQERKLRKQQRTRPYTRLWSRSTTGTHRAATDAKALVRRTKFVFSPICTRDETWLGADAIGFCP